MSSSGHLVLGGTLLGLGESRILFGVVVHAATLVATLVFYRRAVAEIVGDCRASLRDLAGRQAFFLVMRARPNAWLAILLVAGTVPTAIVGLLFKAPLERLYGSPRLVAGVLLVTAALLLVTRFLRPGDRQLDSIGIRHAVLVGIAQSLAILPGISRSGITIGCALLLGFDRELAARFSFLLSVPAILGALTVALLDAGARARVDGVGLAVGFLSATLVGLAALALLIPIVRRGRLHWFAAYLVPAGLLGLVLVP